jgi:hypothetical protein
VRERRLGFAALATSLVLLFSSSSSSPAQPARELHWEYLAGTIALERAKVPGGWLVAIEQPTTRGGPSLHPSLIFYPDPEHAWDGGSLP